MQNSMATIGIEEGDILEVKGYIKEDKYHQIMETTAKETAEKLSV